MCYNLQMIRSLVNFMQKLSSKTKEMPVVKAVKGSTLPIEDGILRDKKGQPIKLLHVVNENDEVVETFNHSELGPRYWFKATQYAYNNSSPSNRLRVKEIDS